jgi:hypothetical protein
MRSIARVAASSILLATLSACDQPTSRPEPAESGSEAAALRRPGAPAVVAEVAWPAPARLDRTALRALPKTAARAVQASSVPVLVPPRRELLGAPVIVTRDRWTSFWARTPEITVSISMSRSFRQVEGIGPVTGPHKVRGLPAFVTTTEGIWSAAWMEHGVSYALDLECASPEAAACASDALLLELVNGLVYVGGAGAAEVPR